MTHWTNPWPDAVPVPIEELAECHAGLGKGCGMPDGTSIILTKEEVLRHWRTAGDRLDAYILPATRGDACIGIRYGEAGPDYLSPHGDQEKIAALLKRYQNKVTFTMTVETEVDEGWIEFVTGGPEGMCDIFFQNGYCGYWMMGMAHGKDVGKPELGWLAWEHASGEKRPKRAEVDVVIALWKEGKPLPEHWLRLDLDLAKRSWVEGYRKGGAEWYENGDGCTYDCAVQRALFKGEVVYG